LHEKKPTKKVISIPSGAIKRSAMVADLASAVQKFQFLLVRLKVDTLTITHAATAEFQFLLVRLKDNHG